MAEVLRIRNPKLKEAHAYEGKAWGLFSGGAGEEGTPPPENFQDTSRLQGQSQELWF